MKIEKLKDSVDEDEEGNFESLYPAFENPLFEAVQEVIHPSFLKSGNFKEATGIIGNSLRDDFSDLDSSFEQNMIDYEQSELQGSL